MSIIPPFSYFEQAVFNSVSFLLIFYSMVYTFFLTHERDVVQVGGQETIVGRVAEDRPKTRPSSFITALWLTLPSAKGLSCEPGVVHGSEGMHP